MFDTGTWRKYSRCAPQTQRVGSFWRSGNSSIWRKKREISWGEAFVIISFFSWNKCLLLRLLWIYAVRVHVFDCSSVSLRNIELVSPTEDKREFKVDSISTQRYTQPRWRAIYWQAPVHIFNTLSRFSSLQTCRWPRPASTMPSCGLPISTSGSNCNSDHEKGETSRILLLSFKTSRILNPSFQWQVGVHVPEGSAAEQAGPNSANVLLHGQRSQLR